MSKFEKGDIVEVICKGEGYHGDYFRGELGVVWEFDDSDLIVDFGRNRSQHRVGAIEVEAVDLDSPLPWLIKQAQGMNTNLNVKSLDYGIKFDAKHILVGCQKISVDDGIEIANAILNLYSY